MPQRKRVSLLINIDHIATLRNARGGTSPDPVEAARVCIRAGADGVVSHLREDRRHIRDADVRRLKASVHAKFDLEMAATPDIVRIALLTKPDLVTLVPERRMELTTEGGLDVAAHRRSLAHVVRQFHSAGIPVSLFVDPIARQLRAAQEVGADIVELHTGEYADASSAAGRRKQLTRLRTAATRGSLLGLRIHAGHGLDYANTHAIAAIPELRELSIGYAIIARSLEVGLSRAVREMVAIVRGAGRATARR